MRDNELCTSKINDNDGGPAFPYRPADVGCEGMTLRDWFAGMALQGRAHRFDHPHQHRELLARDCYEIADAMLTERNRKEET